MFLTHTYCFAPEDIDSSTEVYGLLSLLLYVLFELSTFWNSFTCYMDSPIWYIFLKIIRFVQLKK